MHVVHIGVRLCLSLEVSHAVLKCACAQSTAMHLAYPALLCPRVTFLLLLATWHWKSRAAKVSWPPLPSLQELLHLSRDSFGVHVRSCTVSPSVRAGPADVWRLISSVAACLPGLQKLECCWRFATLDRPRRGSLLWAPLRALHHLQEANLTLQSASTEAMQLELQVRADMYVRGGGGERRVKGREHCPPLKVACCR